MTATTMPRFRVYVEPSTDGITWWSDTDDVPGLTVVADSLRELRTLVEEAALAHVGTADVALDLVVDLDDEPENVPAPAQQPADALPAGSDARTALITIAAA